MFFFMLSFQMLNSQHLTSYRKEVELSTSFEISNLNFS